MRFIGTESKYQRVERNINGVKTGFEKEQKTTYLFFIPIAWRTIKKDLNGKVLENTAVAIISFANVINQGDSCR